MSHVIFYEDLDDEQRQWLVEFAQENWLLTDEPTLIELCKTFAFQARLITRQANKIVHEGLIAFHREHRN